MIHVHDILLQISSIKCLCKISDRYYVAFKPITLLYIFFMFIKIKFIHCHSFVMYTMKSISVCNDYVIMMKSQYNDH